ncbi:hypothetical protein B0H11DRAFT_2195386, partial [Mycena galericulata]
MLLVLVPPPSPLATLSILDASLPILDAVLPALNAVLPVLDAAHPVLDDAVPAVDIRRRRARDFLRATLLRRASRRQIGCAIFAGVNRYIKTRAVDMAGATSSTTLANSASVHDVRAVRLQGSKCARTSGIQYHHFDASAAHTWRTSCIDLRKALSINTLQPTNLLARAMSGTTRVCARCRAAHLRGSELHAHQIEDTVYASSIFWKTHAPSDPHIPLDPVERCRLFTLYIDSNDTELLPIRCSTLNSIFLGTR